MKSMDGSSDHQLSRQLTNMPWQIKQNVSGCKGFAVVKQGTNELVGCHPSKSRATAHLKALYASEADSQKIKKSILGDNTSGR